MSLSFGWSLWTWSTNLGNQWSTFYLLRLLPCPGSLHAQDIRQSYAVSLLCSLHLIHRKCSSSFASAKSENGVTPRPQPLVWCHRLLHPDFCSLDSSGRTRTPAHLYPPWKINIFNPPSNWMTAIFSWILPRRQCSLPFSLSGPGSQFSPKIYFLKMISQTPFSSPFNTLWEWGVSRVILYQTVEFTLECGSSDISILAVDCNKWKKSMNKGSF